MTARIACCAILLALWFACSASASPGEIVAGIAVAGLAAAAHVHIRRTTGARSGGTRVRWLWQALRAWPVTILRETATIVRAVPHAPARRGGLRQVALDPAGPAELAWTIVGTSISPNAYVIGWDPRARVLLLHALDPARDEAQLVWRPR